MPHAMNTRPNRRQALATIIATALLPACGGGTDVAGVSSGGTGSFTTGTITGLGSVIVNGIRYDDRAATISLNGASSDASALQLGMVVRIQGSPVAASATPGGLGTATADTIACVSEWKGMVSAVNTTATPKTFALLGQTVQVLATTVFDDGGLTDLQPNRLVEVYGFVDPSDNSLTATRVEFKTALDRYRLSGTVRNPTDRSFQLGTATIAYPSASQLSNGQLVRVELATSVNGLGQWVAIDVKREDFSHQLDDDDEAEIEGTITAFTSPTAFSVSGIPVDASGMTPPSGLALGVRVEVKGRVLNRVVRATHIEVEDDRDIESRPYEFHGTVSAIDTMARTFTVRGYTLHYDDATVFQLHGATWNASLTTRIEAKAKLQPNGELLATEVETED